MREIYFTENKNAALVLDSENKLTAKKLLDSFPLFEPGKIEFELMALRSYNGYERLMK